MYINLWKNIALFPNALSNSVLLQSKKAPEQLTSAEYVYLHQDFYSIIHLYYTSLF